MSFLLATAIGRGNLRLSVIFAESLGNVIGAYASFEELSKSTDYSARSAIIGSTRVARCAGSQQARSVTDPRSKVTTVNVIGSAALTP